MKARISRASTYRYKETKTFNTLKELLDWQKEINEDIIIEAPPKEVPTNNVYEIIIYDDWIE